MSKAKMSVLSLLATLAAIIAMTSTASANNTHIFLIEQTPLITSSEATVGQSRSAQLEMAFAKTQIVIECQEDTSTGSMKPEGKSEFEILFRNCYVLTKTKAGAKEFLTACTVEEPIKIEGTDELIEHSVDEFGSFKGSLNIIGASCTVASKSTFEGKELCAIPESEFEKVIHHLICTPVGSAFKILKEPTQLFTEEQLKLSSSKPWAGK